MKIKSVVRHYKQWGFLGGSYYCFMRLLRPVLTVCEIRVRTKNPNSKMPVLEAGFEIRVASEEELVELSKDQELSLDEDMVIKAYSRGDLCVAAFFNGEMAAYVWRAFGDTPHLHGLWVSIKQGSLYGYKAFTRPKYRQKRLQHAVSQFADELTLNREIKYVIGFIETHNYPSLISSKKRGNKCVGYAGYFTIYGNIIPFRSLGAKQHGFSFYIPKY